MASMQVTDAQIAEAAFHLWLNEGRPEGHAEDHWYRARVALETPAPKARKPRKKVAAADTPKARTATAKTARPKAPRANKG